ncbi:MAG: hypothetical protein SF066_21490, partial [Thermoanaerobaculia bacterium]|nr:hypothetical protein [Thermoanaerobaculia bacterium]
MADIGEKRHRHVWLIERSLTERFSTKGGGPKPYAPARERVSHAAELRRQLEAVTQAMKSARREARLAREPDAGLQIEFVSFPDVALAVERLDRSTGIELRNVRTEKGTTLATVYVPAGKL